MEPIFTQDLFQKLDLLLIDLLKSLPAEDWQKQTLAPQWKVRDVAVHLLDGNLRSLSMLRDGYFGVKPERTESYDDIVVYLNLLNAEWVRAMKRLSPAVLIDLLEYSGRQYTDFIHSLDPFAEAAFPVAWAGETRSANWFHIAREYTEKWHHQQQIRQAVGLEAPLYSPEFYFPYLETSMRALAHHYRAVAGEEQDLIRFNVDGPGGGVWYLRFQNGAWRPQKNPADEPVCIVSIPGAIAWRIFTKGIARADAAGLVRIRGHKAPGEKILDMLAVMA